MAICEQISAINERDHCFKEVAEATGDAALCNKIQIIIIGGIEVLKRHHSVK